MKIITTRQERETQKALAEAERALESTNDALLLAVRDIMALQDTLLLTTRSTHDLIVAFRLSIAAGVDIDEELDELEREYADAVARGQEHIVR